MSGNRKRRELPEGMRLFIWREGDSYFGEIYRGLATMYECSARTLLGCVRKLMEHAIRGKQAQIRPKAKFSPRK